MTSNGRSARTTGPWFDRTRGLLTGHVPRAVVGGFHRELADLYEPGDRVFLFGSSRGAFAVRAPPTTWGGLDADEDFAPSRVPAVDREVLRRQDVLEVWFSGCHADVGGGRREAVTARIALRWMLGEAAAVEPALLLKRRARGSDGERHPESSPRGGVVHPHASVHGHSGVAVHETRRA